MAGEGPLILLAPLKPGAKFAGEWGLASAEIRNDSDLLLRASNGGSGETLLLWLTRREDSAPHYAQTHSFNITHVSTVPGSPSDREKEALGFLIRTIEGNDKGEVVLLQKDDPSRLILSRGEGREPSRWGYSPALVLGGVLVGLFLLYRYVAKRRLEVIHRWAEWAVLALAVVVSVILRFHGMAELGPETLLADEARIGLGALSIMKYKTLILNYASPHEPPLSLYYPIPFLHLFGNDVWVLRIAPAMAGVLSVLFAYGFAKELFNRQVALLMAVAMATSSLEVTFSRILYEHSFMPMFTCAFLYGFARHVRTGRFRPLVFAGFAAGLGLSTKIIFLYFLGAFGAALLLSGYFRKVEWSRRNLLTLSGSILAGALPLLVYALQPASEFLPSILAAPGAPWQTDLAAVLSERERLARIAFTPWLVPMMVFWIACFIFRRRLNREILLFLFMYPLLYLESLVTISGAGIYHFMVFLPIPYVFFTGILHEFKVEKEFVVPIAALVLLLWGFNRNWQQPSGLYGGILFDEVIPILRELPPSETIAMHHDLSYVQYFLHSESDLPSLDDCRIVTLKTPRPHGGCWSAVADDLENRFRLRVYEIEGRKPSIDDYEATQFGPAEAEAMREVVTTLVEVEHKRSFLFLENPMSQDFARVFEFVYPKVKRALAENGTMFRERRVAGPEGRAALRVIRVEKP